MNTTIEDYHTEKLAYIYIRQSTMDQVRNHTESTQRQYALEKKAIELGWSRSNVRILDGDLGLSGAEMNRREDFKTLLADVSLGHVGAIFALEVSRLARSELDWQRLLLICAFTKTLVIDADGCYDPAEFNDDLLLSLKGTFAAAELHLLQGRLQGGKRNKAQRGELRLPLPVGLTHDEQGRIVLDPDEEVQGAVRLVFETFRRTGSAYAVMQEFAQQGLRFPKRVYGGIWNEKLNWGILSHSRVLVILKNPAYAGVYFFGQHRHIREITPEGDVRHRSRLIPMDQWPIYIPDHHEAYLSLDEFLKNTERLALNRTNLEENLSSGPAREGHALLQGLLLCAGCGHKLHVHYKSKEGISPRYGCKWPKREEMNSSACVTMTSVPLDAAVCKRALEVIASPEINVAIKAIEELQKRDEAQCKQWQMRIQRAEYEAQLAEKRYMEVDPLNRLVANSLEKRWNDALLGLEDIKREYAEFRKKELRVVTEEQKSHALALIKDFGRLWHAPTTKTKDKKRMLRLLIKDITVERSEDRKQAILKIRWHGRACETLSVELASADKRRYPADIVERVRTLVHEEVSDAGIADVFNREGRVSSTGKFFTISMIKWIRYKHNIVKEHPIK